MNLECWEQIKNIKYIKGISTGGILNSYCLQNGQYSIRNWRLKTVKLLQKASGKLKLTSNARVCTDLPTHQKKFETYIENFRSIRTYSAKVFSIVNKRRAKVRKVIERNTIAKSGISFANKTREKSCKNSYLKKTWGNRRKAEKLEHSFAQIICTTAMFNFTRRRSKEGGEEKQMTMRKRRMRGRGRGGESWGGRVRKWWWWRWRNWRSCRR